MGLDVPAGAVDRGLFARFKASIDPKWVLEALAATGTATVRRRRFPAEQVVWLVLGMALFRDISIVHVVRCLALVLPGSGASQIADSAVAQVPGWGRNPCAGSSRDAPRPGPRRARSVIAGGASPCMESMARQSGCRTARETEEVRGCGRWPRGERVSVGPSRDPDGASQPPFAHGSVRSLQGERAALRSEAVV
jgi:hypothetical protein